VAQTEKDEVKVALKKKSDKKDVHVELPSALCERIAALAATENRSFPRQLATLLESHPALARR
jgi:hypothetical protein